MTCWYHSKLAFVLRFSDFPNAVKLWKTLLTLSNSSLSKCSNFDKNHQNDFVQKFHSEKC